MIVSTGINHRLAHSLTIVTEENEQLRAENKRLKLTLYGVISVWGIIVGTLVYLGFYV